MVRHPRTKRREAEMSVALETLTLELGAALSATPAQAAWLWTDEPQLFDDNGHFSPRRGELVG